MEGKTITNTQDMGFHEDDELIMIILGEIRNTYPTVTQSKIKEIFDRANKWVSVLPINWTGEF